MFLGALDTLEQREFLLYVIDHHCGYSGALGGICPLFNQSFLIQTVTFVSSKQKGLAL